MGIKAGNLPTSTIDGTDCLLITEGEAPKRVNYADVKKDILGTEILTTTAQTIKGAINEVNADLSEKAKQVDLTTTNTNLSNHIDELATNTNGIHGLKVSHGTFIPTLVGITGGEATYQNRIGSYTKIDNVVNFNLILEISSKNNMSGEVLIGGLPYSTKINTSVGFLQNGVNLKPNGKFLVAELSNNVIHLYNELIFDLVDSAELNNLAWMHISGSYIINEV